MYNIITRSTLHQAFACSPVLFNALLIGFGWGWIAPTIVHLQEADSVLPMTEDEASWVASINEVGRICSPFILPFVVDTFGRKYGVMMVALLFLVTWPCQIFARNVFLLCVIRFIFGLANGAHDVVAGIYTTENCSTELRGIIGSIVTVVFSAGCFVELFLATFLAYETVTLVNTAIAVLTFGTMFFCVETPYFLIMKEKFYKAEINLVWLQGGEMSQHSVSNTMEKLKFSVQEESRKRGSIKTLFASKANYTSIYIVLILYTMASATGHSAIVPYSSMIFTSSDTLSSNHFTILYGVTNFLAVCTSPFVLKLINRRKFMVTSFLITTMCNLSTFFLIHLRDAGVQMECLPWLIFASVATFGAVRSLQFSTTFVLRGELLPLSVRAIGCSMSVVINAAAGFGVSKTFLPLTECYGMKINFLLYAILSAFTAIFTYFALPETRGRSLDEIQKCLDGKKPTYDNPPRNPNVLFYKTDNNKFSLTSQPHNKA